MSHEHVYTFRLLARQHVYMNVLYNIIFYAQFYNHISGCVN